MLKKTIAFFNIIRWKELFIMAFTMLTMHYCIIIPFFSYYKINLPIDNTQLILAVLSLIFLFAGGNIINNYYDRKTDLINRPNKVVVIFSIRRRLAILYHLLFSALGIILGILLSFSIGKAYFSFAYILIFLFLWIYSSNLKKKFLLNNFSAALLASIIPLSIGIIEYFAYESSISEWNEINIHPVKLSIQFIIGFSIFAFLINLIREILKDCRDIRGDLETGNQTVPTRLGKKSANKIIFILSLFFISLIILSWELYISKLIFFNKFIFAGFYIYSMLVLPSVILSISILFGYSSRKYINLIKLIDFIILIGLVFSFIIRFAIYAKI